MQVRGLDAYRASVPLDDKSSKHKEALNKTNQNDIENAKNQLEKQAQPQKPIQDLSVNAGQRSPVQPVVATRTYNFTYMSVNDVQAAVQNFSSIGEKKLSEYLQHSLMQLKTSYQQYMPRKNGVLDQTQPFNFLSYLQTIKTDDSQESLMAVEQLLGQLKTYHQGIDERI